MPEITDAEMAELNRLRSSEATSQLSVAISNFRADNPHIPQPLLETYQGDPAEFPKFGAELLKSLPKPEPAAPAQVPAPVAAAPGPNPPPVAAPAAPAPAQAQAAAFVPPPPPTPGSMPPIMAAQPQLPASPEAVRAAYMQQAANGQATVLTPEQAAANAAAAQAGGPVPTPGLGDVLTPQNALAAQSENIRERMRLGVAKPEEVYWLAQYGEKGFREAIVGHARKVRAMVGQA